MLKKTMVLMATMASMMFVPAPVALMAAQDTQAPAGRGKPACCSMVQKGAQKDFCMQYDANKDGKISADEFKAMQTGCFKQIDANHDGMISLEEWLANNPCKDGKKGRPGCMRGQMPQGCPRAQ